MKYEAPEMEIIQMEIVDVITQSFGDGTYDDDQEPGITPPGGWT